ncbi:MAG: histidine kinase dimerization/phospho-acceptor domain-containing protein, partial [Rheinheimera sp.]
MNSLASLATAPAIGSHAKSYQPLFELAVMDQPVGELPEADLVSAAVIAWPKLPKTAIEPPLAPTSTEQAELSRLQHLLQVLPTGVVVLDARGFVQQANPVAISMLGEPLTGQRWLDVITRSFRPRSDDGMEVSLHDGRRVQLAITSLQPEPGQLIVLTDLTETRQLQSRIAHLQRLSALGKMMASLAHQIRTPLSSAMLYAQNLTNLKLDQNSRQQFQHKLL